MPSKHTKRIKNKSPKHENRSAGDLIGCGPVVLVFLILTIGGFYIVHIVIS